MPKAARLFILLLVLSLTAIVHADDVILGKVVVRHTPGPRSDANPMVPGDRTHQSDQQVFVVNPLKETAWYVARMPGGVRGEAVRPPSTRFCQKPFNFLSLNH